MRLTNILSAATVCLATAEGFKFQLHSALTNPIESAYQLAKRASTITTPFKYAAPQFSFYVDVLVGSAHDFIRLRLSSDPFTWFPGPLPSPNYCSVTTLANRDLCLQANFSGTFDPEGSSTFVNLTEVMNLTSSDPRYYAVGYYGQDTLQIGQTEINNVPIGIATAYTRTPQLGLGIGGSGATQDSLIRTMLNEKVISVLAYGLYLNDFSANSSELTIGAVDLGKCDGDLVTFSSSATTGVDVESAEYDSGSGTPSSLSSGWHANIEFSTGLIYFPNSPLRAVTDDLGAEYDSAYGGYLCECGYRWSDKVLSFTFQGVTIDVPASQWIVPAITLDGQQWSLSDGDTPACVVLLASMDDYSIATEAGYDAVLGMPFVRATYMVHDFSNQETSFAAAKYNTSDSEITVLPAGGVPALNLTSSPTNTDVPSTSTPAETTPATPQPDSGSSTPVGAIAGGVVGGVAVIGAAIGAFFFMRRRRRPTEQPPQPPPDMNQNPMAPMGQPPYGGQQPYGGYPPQQQYGEQGYVYNGHSEQYGTAPLMPNKGVDQGNYNQNRPLSEIDGSPVNDPSRFSSLNAAPPSAISELPSPRQNAPVELPGHQ
ncbi:Candidapepsin-6 [Dactylella cylindrospora]|nr:Candidapepsin-6 [Dactylella cylindrospora]